MTRMIERWFPCAEVSTAASTGWGHGKVEKTLFPWFAARPPAQAKAALVCSLLPWPESAGEQERLQQLVIDSMRSRYGAWEQLREEIRKGNPVGADVLDPFSGRGILPLEAARLGLPVSAIDYSPLAVLASRALVEYPFRDWDGEASLPFTRPTDTLLDDTPRLIKDLEIVLDEVQIRYASTMSAYYPMVDGKQPWAYLWAVSLPCLECGLRFPLVSNLQLRLARRVGGREDPGQSFEVLADRATGNYRIAVNEGAPSGRPTLLNAVVRGKKVAGKSAVCPFCTHVHPVAIQRQMTHDGLGQDELLVAADLDDRVGKHFRLPESAEYAAVASVTDALKGEIGFSPTVTAVPTETVAPGNNNIIGPSIYGMRSFGDFMVDRQTLAFVRLARTIESIAVELRDAGLSQDYVQALATYCGAVLARKIRRSGRGCTLDVKVQAAHDIYSNQGSISYSHDFLEVGIGKGQGTWASIAASELSTLRNLMRGVPQYTREARVMRGSAADLPMRNDSFTLVLTDPPYDEMLAYADSSDIVFVWLKRALGNVLPELAITADPHGGQDKRDEIIVKRVRGEAPLEHRTREHYDSRMFAAFAEMRRVVREDGLVTVVFGSGDPDVWRRLLAGFENAGLIMTASWPASTEAGSHQGKANIETTLTMVCRPAPLGRPAGRKGAVETQIKAEIKRRYPDWERWGLAPADMLMAAAGPAMEIVGRYSEILDAKGQAVDIYTFLPLARAAVQEAMAVDIDHHPLETFDARTRFALWWIRLYGKQTQAKSELRWQALASSLDLGDVRDLVPGADKGVQFASARAFAGRIHLESPVIDVALSLAAASEEGLVSMASVLARSGRTVDDGYLWAALKFLADRLPSADPDAIAFHRVLRTRDSIAGAAQNIVIEKVERSKAEQDELAQLRLL
jgi:putative DNA methylase